MAKNIRALADSDIGIATTGIAGPTGSTKKKPVGLVYIALSTSTKTIAKKCYFTGSRKTIKLRSNKAALDMLRYYLIK